MMANRQKFRFTITIIMFLVFSQSCVTEFDPAFPEGQKRLVVEGSITTAPGPYTIKLSQTESFQSFTPDTLRIPLIGATVSITDDTGNIEVMTEVLPGVYRSSGAGMRGEVGRSYQLHISLANGTNYVSALEEISPVAPIDEVTHEFIVKDHQGTFPGALRPPLRINIDPEFGRGFDIPVDNLSEYLNNFPTDIDVEESYLYYRISGTDPEAIAPGQQSTFKNFPLLSNDFVRVHVKTTDQPGSRSYYMWKMRLVFKVETFPETFTLRGVKPQPGDIVNPFWTNWVRLPKTCCGECWVDASFPSFTVDSDLHADGGVLEHQLNDIPVNNFIFQEKVFVAVDQVSLSRNAHLFFSSLSRQIDQVGSIFDTAPGITIGNIVNVDDPDEVVLGFFSASDISTTGFFIDVRDLPALTFLNLSNIQFRFSLPEGRFIFSDDCRVLNNSFMVSSTERPGFWEDN